MYARLIPLITATLLVAAPMAPAQDPHGNLVQAWYQRYLGRVAEPQGLYDHTAALCAGASPVGVEAGILGSDEYFHRNNCNEPTFVAALYRDVLGVAATYEQIQQGVQRLHTLGCDRRLFAIEFLQINRGVAGPIGVAHYGHHHGPASALTVAPSARPVPVTAYRPNPYTPAFNPAFGVRSPTFAFGPYR